MLAITRYDRELQKLSAQAFRQPSRVRTTVHGHTTLYATELPLLVTYDKPELYKSLTQLYADSEPTPALTERQFMSTKR